MSQTLPDKASEDAHRDGVSKDSERVTCGHRLGSPKSHDNTLVFNVAKTANPHFASTAEDDEAGRQGDKLAWIPH